jgi:hypothetical protein
VADPSTVVIGTSDALPRLKERAAQVSNGEMIAFSDAEPLRALDTIVRVKPALVAIERLFAVTPRGAALINRIKADPTLRHAEIRVMEPHSDYSRVVPRPAAAAAPVDQRGTRRATRVKIAEKVTVIVDGKLAALVDLSTVGAQVVSPGTLKLDQEVEIALADSIAKIRGRATTVWAKLETGGNGAPGYRAGLDFIDPDAAAIEAYAQRHKAG